MTDDVVVEFEGDKPLDQFEVNQTDLNKFVIVMCFAVIAQKWLAGS